jgi:hypothetical protein
LVDFPSVRCLATAGPPGLAADNPYCDPCLTVRCSGWAGFAEASRVKASGSYRVACSGDFSTSRRQTRVLGLPSSVFIRVHLCFQTFLSRRGRRRCQEAMETRMNADKAARLLRLPRREIRRRRLELQQPTPYEPSKAEPARSVSLVSVYAVARRPFPVMARLVRATCRRTCRYRWPGQAEP